jgi:predicted dehydrogenase
LTLTVGEGALIQEAAKTCGKTVQVGTQQRSEYGWLFLKAVAIARSGRLGKKLRAVSSVGKAVSRSPNPAQPFGPFESREPPPELDWDMWLGQAPKVPFCPERLGWNFRWWFEYAGGQVTDWGVHHTDIAFWALAGKDGAAVEAEGTGKFMAVPRQQVCDFLLGKIPAKDVPAGFNVAQEFDVEIKLSTGNTIQLVSGPNELLIEGENGRIRVNRGFKAEGQLTGKPVEEIDADGKAKQEIEQLMVEIYGGPLPTHRRGHFQNFFDCVRSGRQPVANVPEHLRAVNACHMANIALLLGRKVRWDIEKQQFLDDADAQALTKRKQREEYRVTG